MSSTPVAIRRPLLALLAALALILTVLPGISSAHDDHDHGAATYEKGCPPALIKKLDRAADNFGMGCDLAGGNLAKLDDSGAKLPPGAVASSKNMGLVANIPKQGEFDDRGRLQQRPGVQGPLRLRRQLQRLHGLRHPQAHPAEGRHPGRLPGFAERRLGLAQPADPQRRLQPQRRLLRQHVACRPPTRRPGRASGSSTSPTPRRRSTSPPWRRRAGRTPTRSRRTSRAGTSSSTCRRTSRAQTSPTASRPMTGSAWSRSRAARRTPPTSRRRRCSSPTGACPAAATRPRPAAATTSPPTRSATSRRAPAWATAS